MSNEMKLVFCWLACLNLLGYSLKIPSSSILSTSWFNPTFSQKDAVSKYFECWNKREMDKAVELFDNDCVYEDTLYSGVFFGKDALKKHLKNVAASLPQSFKFVVDDLSEDKENRKVGVQWHVESDGSQLPFTRGCSMYTLNKMGLIVKGFDVPEPVVKSGPISLALLRTASSLIENPTRLLPWSAWLFYCWFLFLSDIPPGPNALSLDPNTWIEVFQLSINFWLVLPLLNISNAPILHPVLEGTFNFLLVWAGLFFGFIMDRRFQKSRNGPDFLPTLIGMQLLTNAIYLPYLATRQTYTSSDPPSKLPLTSLERVSESKVFPIIFGCLGVLFLFWAAEGRQELFGDIPTRLATFQTLLSHDRLTFSFIIDLLYFSFFQGWLIDDDIQQREPIDSSVERNLKWIGKSIPFFGLIYYFLYRPKLISNNAM